MGLDRAWEMMETLKVAIGLGCQRGASLSTLECAIAEALRPLGALEVCLVASHVCKTDEAALLELTQIHGWALRFFTTEALDAVPVANPSPRVVSEIGTPSVCEAAALLAAGSTRLLVEKHIHRGADGKGATVAVARMTAGKQGLSK